MNSLPICYCLMRISDLFERCLSFVRIGIRCSVPVSFVTEFLSFLAGVFQSFSDLVEAFGLLDFKLLFFEHVFCLIGVFHHVLNQRYY